MRALVPSETALVLGGGGAKGAYEVGAIAALDELQAEMSTARQFLFTARCKNLKPEQVFQKANAVEKRISEQGFEVHRMKKPEIKRFLALYFESFQPL